MNLYTLPQLATFPGTHDRDRYARTVRAELRKVMDEVDNDSNASAAVVLVLHGLLRLTDRRESVAQTRERLCVGLDLLATLTGQLWRLDTPTHHQEQPIREAGLFSNPSAGKELVDRGVLIDFDPFTCVCIEQPQNICFSNIHEI